MRFKKWDMVVIDWEDSSTMSGWSSQETFEEKARDTLRCCTVGFLLSKNKKSVSVMQNLSFVDGKRIGNIGEMMQIPASIIRNIRKVQ